MKPSYLSCGHGGVINCRLYDVLYGCKHDEEDTRDCQVFDSYKEVLRENRKGDND